jgi:proline iminopeptidase
MKIKKISIGFFLFFAALLICFGVLYFINSGNYTVPETTAMNKNLPSLEFDGYLFHSEAFGLTNEQTIIILHGGPGNDYRSLLPLEALSDNYQVVFYDQRGTGLSPRVEDEEITLDIYLNDLDHFVEYYGKGNKVALLGHSWGAMLATAYTGLYPDKVDKLVLVEPGFLTPEMASIYMEKTNRMQPEKITFEFIAHVITVFFESLHINGPDTEARRDFFMSGLSLGKELEGHPLAGYFKDGKMSNGSLEFWRAGAMVPSIFFRDAMDEDGNFTISFINGIESYNNKVLFLAGEFNIIIGEEHQRKQMKYFPNSEIAVIADAGHTMIGEKPRETVRVIREYLKD